jgi:hypothetical protein
MDDDVETLRTLWTRDAAELQGLWRLPSATVDPRRIQEELECCVDGTLRVAKRRLQEVVALRRLDPWTSAGREVGLGADVPVGRVHDAWRRGLGIREPAAGWGWVDFMAIGVYVGVVCCMASLIGIHYGAFRFPLMARDLLTSGLLLPTFAMAIVQIMVHTRPLPAGSGGAAGTVAVSSVEVAGLSSLRVVRDGKEVVVAAEADVRVRGRSEVTGRVTGELRLPLALSFDLGAYSLGNAPPLAYVRCRPPDLPRSAKAWTIRCEGFPVAGPLETHYGQELLDCLWGELRPLLGEALSVLTPPAPAPSAGPAAAVQEGSDDQGTGAVVTP